MFVAGKTAPRERGFLMNLIARLLWFVRNEMSLANVILRSRATKNLNLRVSNEEIASPAARNDMSVGRRLLRGVKHDIKGRGSGI